MKKKKKTGKELGHCNPEIYDARNVNDLLEGKFGAVGEFVDPLTGGKAYLVDIMNTWYKFFIYKGDPLYQALEKDPKKLLEIGLLYQSNQPGPTVIIKLTQFWDWQKDIGGNLVYNEVRGRQITNMDLMELTEKRRNEQSKKSSK